MDAAPQQYTSAVDYYKCAVASPLGPLWRLFFAPWPGARELSYSCLSKDGKEKMARFVPVESEYQLRNILYNERLLRVDVGAVYAANLELRQAMDTLTLADNVVGNFLAFDVDADGYERSCGCCRETLCAKCWLFMSTAVRVLDIVLREAWGFTQVRYFFSGRRGIHAWVFDDRSLSMNAEARATLVKYLTSAWKGRPIAAYDACMKHVHRSVILPAYGQYKEKGGKARSELPEGDMTPISMHTMMPILDEEVTLQAPHLLKAPLSVHPATGYVCSELWPETCADFYPSRLVRTRPVK